MSLTVRNRQTCSVLGICCPAAHNGVGRNHQLQCFSSAASTPPVASSRKQEDELDNWSDELDGCPCSSRVGRKAPQKELRLTTRFPHVIDGSLPSSPGDEDSGCVPVGEYSCKSDEVLDQETHELMENFFRVYTGICPACRRQKKAISTMKRVVDNVIEKHQIAYNGMIRKLNWEQQGDDMAVVRAVAQKIFSDGTTNWGRIVSLVAFGAEVCRHLKESGREHCVDTVGRQISSYLLSEQRDWLLSNKAWDGFVEFFHVEDTESAVRNALFALAGVAGIGAGLAFLIR